MMKLRISSFLLLAFLPAAIAFHASSVAAQTDTAKLDVLRDQWKKVNFGPAPKDYGPVIKALEAYSRTPGGRSWIVDYWLGSSYCHTPGMQAKGMVELRRALDSKDVPAEGASAAQNVQKSCGQPSTESTQPAFELVPVFGQQAAAGYAGKGGFRLQAGTEHISEIQLSTVTIDDLHTRLFAPAQASDALAAAIKRAAPPQLKGAVTDGILVLTSQYDDPAAVGACLVTYRAPMQEQFDMKPPQDLITTYSTYVEHVPDLAARLHGVRIPLGTVAYSVYEDLSIVGQGDGYQCGTLAHELMHLYIRQNFGDAPAWLEEGLASEIAVSRPGPGSFQFLKSWRDVELKRDAAIRPSVAELLHKRWPDYTTGDEDDLDKVAALHAMAAAFIRYLASKNGRLELVYFAIRDAVNSKSPRTDEEILQSTLSMDLTQIDADFDAWFKTSDSQ